MRPLPPSVLISLWIHGSLLGFLWLPTGSLLDVVEEMEEGARIGADRIAGQAIAASLSALEPEQIHNVSITLLDPAPQIPTELPATIEVQKTPRAATTADIAAVDRDEGSSGPGEGGSFEANGRSGDGTASRTKNKKPCEDRSGIWTVEDGHWGIQRSVVDYYTAHFPELDRQAGSEPYRDESGKPAGLKIVLSRCSVLKEAGLRSGDIIHSANGLKVHSYAQALGAWLRLRNYDRIRLEVTRKGQPMTLYYQIED